jgi:hypothetical protein
MKDVRAGDDKVADPGRRMIYDSKKAGEKAVARENDAKPRQLPLHDAL